jgi:hypothetical protein
VSEIITIGALATRYARYVKFCLFRDLIPWPMDRWVRVAA